MPDNGGPLPTQKWPRLSADLPHGRHPHVCQACGQRDLICGEGLERWREHDDQDRPEPVLVILCPPCANRLIGPHERLYGPVDRLAPWPGAMPLCIDCAHRDGLNCKHPDLKSNGGAGLAITYPSPDVFLVCTGGAGGGRHVIYHGQVSACAGRAIPTATEGSA